MIEEIKYYKGIPALSEEPTTVFRFFSNPPKAEKYVTNTGWVRDTSLYILFASGELTEDEEVSKAEAEEIISILESKK